MKKDLNNILNKPKHIETIMEEQIEEALRQHGRSSLHLLFSSISAGLELGFSVFLMASVYSLYSGMISPALMHTVLAFSYSIGFIFVIIGKSELFTEHTTLAVIPVLSKSAGVKSLLLLWLVVYVGNLLGGYLFAAILGNVPVKLGIIDIDSFYQLALKLTEHSWVTILGSGVLAGWLMGLLSWLVTSAQETISRILLVILVTAIIGIGGLHHSIVGSIEVFTAMITHPGITLNDYMSVQVFSTIGNLIGGVVFVALVKFSHAIPNKKEKTPANRKL